MPFFGIINRFNKIFWGYIIQIQDLIFLIMVIFLLNLFMKPKKGVKPEKGRNELQMTFRRPWKLKLTFDRQNNCSIGFLDPKNPLNEVSFIFLPFSIFLS